MKTLKQTLVYEFWPAFFVAGKVKTARQKLTAVLMLL
jgi:hypothetical protein